MLTECHGDIWEYLWGQQNKLEFITDIYEMEDADLQRKGWDKIRLACG